ncbi:glycosyltransferase family 39 protein [Microlunatus flavus]|uniref:Mannosyltransferase n=1 Tax=Microlunatus flavus TaxID=1036181 RepID=A0A1H9MSD9_9ACTN|nr:glycosyltransferase family 39 protein [Microlunatus flavus]SER26626.1 mannosyltransferase [Microlunatus flavus]
MPSSAPTRTASVVVRAVAVFVMTTGLVGAGSWVPTQSRDEAATVSAVTRTWAQLGQMLQNVDVVHALFYATMKVWLDVVGISTLTLRAPSAVACGLAAGLVVVLGSLLFTPRAGLLAGLVMAVCPRVTLVGTEGRSGAWFTAAAVLLVVLVVLSARRPSALWVLPVALATALVGGLHVYSALMLPVLVVWLWAPPDPEGRPRRILRLGLPPGRWPALVGLLLGAVPVVVLAWRARGQQAQVDWIDPPTPESLAKIATEPLAPLNGLWAVLCWAMAAAGLVWLSRHRKGRRGTTFLLVGWAVVPGLALITVSAVWTPLYSQRYLAFCVGALAVLAGGGIASVRRRWLAFCLAAALPLAGTTTYRDQRTVDAWDSWGQIAAVVAYRGNPGDAVIDYPLVSAITVSYPGALGTGPVLNAGADRLSRHYLWDDRLPLSAVEPRLRGVQRLWYLSPVADEAQRTLEIRRLRELGFSGDLLERSDAEQTWLFTRTAAQAERGDLLLRTPR